MSPVQLRACIAPWLTLFRLSISYLRSQDLAPSRTHEVAEIVLFILFPLPHGHTARFYYLAFFVRATRQKCVQEIVGRSDACPALTSPLNPPMTSSTLSGETTCHRSGIPKVLRKKDLRDGRGLSPGVTLCGRPFHLPMFYKRNIVTAVSPP